MSKPETGGSAFPHMAAEGHRDYRPGLTKREWYAGQALAGILAFPGTINNKYTKDPDQIAALAFQLADAMIAEGSK